MWTEFWKVDYKADVAKELETQLKIGVLTSADIAAFKRWVYLTGRRVELAVTPD